MGIPAAAGGAMAVSEPCDVHEGEGAEKGGPGRKEAVARPRIDPEMCIFLVVKSKRGHREEPPQRKEERDVFGVPCSGLEEHAKPKEGGNRPDSHGPSERLARVVIEAYV